MDCRRRRRQQEDGSSLNRCPAIGSARLFSIFFTRLVKRTETRVVVSAADSRLDAREERKPHGDGVLSASRQDNRKRFPRSDRCLSFHERSPRLASLPYFHRQRKPPRFPRPPLITPFVFLDGKRRQLLERYLPPRPKRAFHDDDASSLRKKIYNVRAENILRTFNHVCTFREK